MQVRYLIARSSNDRVLAAIRGRLERSKPGFVREIAGGTFVWVNESGTDLDARAGFLYVIGDIFPKKDLSEAAGGVARPIGVSHLEKCVSEFWGSYMAVKPPGAGGDMQVLRAPMGALPAYYVLSHDLIVVASDVDLMQELGLVRRGVDWDALPVFLSSVSVVSHRTCLAGVQELPPGCVLTIDERLQVGVNPMWKFWDYAECTRIPSRQAAETQVRHAIEGVTRHLIRRAGAVGVSLSGGLDSSIVASCAAAEGQRPVLMTFAADDPDGDERLFARAVASRLGLELLEFQFEREEVDLFVSSSRHLPRPIGNAQTQSVARQYTKIASQLGLTAIMNGMGGDNVFCTNSSSLPLVDAFLGRASFSEFRDTLTSLQNLTGVTKTKIVAQMLRVLARGRKPNWKPSLANFLRGEPDRCSGDPLAFSWLGLKGQSPPGKQYHVEMIVRSMHTSEGFHRATTPAWLSPLMSQPVVEACLKVRTWQWTSGGMNRAVARTAFSDRLPPCVAYRRTKGGPDAFLRDFALSRRTLLREIILDGELVRRGILDQRRLEGAFADDSMLRDGYHAKLLHIADIEAWIAYWDGLTLSADDCAPAV